jgi:hypothetical protein
VVLQSFFFPPSLVDQRAVGSGGPYFSPVIVFRLFFLAGMLFYVGDASATDTKSPEIVLQFIYVDNSKLI